MIFSNRWRPYPARNSCEYKGRALRYLAQREERLMEEKLRRWQYLHWKVTTGGQVKKQNCKPSESDTSSIPLDTDDNASANPEEISPSPVPDDSWDQAPKPFSALADMSEHSSGLIGSWRRRIKYHLQTYSQWLRQARCSSPNHPQCVKCTRNLLQCQIQQHQRKSLELHETAAYNIFTSRNRPYDQETIDLAGLLVHEAQTRLVERLRQCLDRGQPHLVILLPSLAHYNAACSKRSSMSSGMTYIEGYSSDLCAPPVVSRPSLSTNCSRRTSQLTTSSTSSSSTDFLSSAAVVSSCQSEELEKAKIDQEVAADRPRLANVVREMVMVLLKEYNLAYVLDSPTPGSLMVFFPSL
ncbi:hypothetical protein IWQ62_005331 [Dispira parvispora]|uniref:Uncharacterized protein n=1 Tax=Dispira parvispora TaxID=1520584 RepID=A0A9W8E5B9_9FUNG|nr:hypothetical protein IWQ62_005331 [Dispira parvispora]